MYSPSSSIALLERSKRADNDVCYPRLSSDFSAKNMSIVERMIKQISFLRTWNTIRIMDTMWVSKLNRSTYADANVHECE